MATIGATQLIMGFLGLRESEVDSIQPIPDAKLIKIGRSQLDRTMTGITYALSMEQGFLIIFILISVDKPLFRKHFGEEILMPYIIW